MSIGGNLRRLRLERGLTQEQVAERIGLTRQALSSYESGRTRPDIEMLERLCRVYGVGLEELIYGGPARPWERRLKWAAAGLLALLAALTLASSACLWGANFFFPISPGALAPEGREILEAHLGLTGAWEALDGLILALSLPGFTALLLLSQAVGRALPLRRKLRYAAALAGALLLAAAPFAAADQVFAPVDYLITPLQVAFQALCFLAADLAIGFLRRKSAGKDGPA